MKNYLSIKALLILCALTALAVGPRAWAAGITNGSFETGDLTGWLVWPNAPGVTVIDDAAAPEGAKVVKIDFSSDNNRLIQDIASPTSVLTEGQEYTLSVWMKYDTDNTSDFPSMIWHNMDSEGVLVGDFNSQAGPQGDTATWTKIAMSVTPTSVSTMRVMIAGNSSGLTATGSVWFDDVTMEEAAAPALIENGSFETGDLTGWIGWPDAASISVIDDSAAPDGAKVAQVAYSNTNKLIYDMADAPSKVTEGESYNLTVWYHMTTSNSGDAAALVGHYLDSGGLPTGDYLSTLGNPTDSWTKLSLTLTGTDQPTLRIMGIAGANELSATGTAWFDDFLLEEQTGLLNLVTNGGFETGDLTGWIGFPNAAAISVVDEAAAPEGVKVARVGFSSQSNKLIQDIAEAASKAIPGQGYDLSAWYRMTSDWEENYTALAWHYMDAAQTPLLYHSVTSSKGDTTSWMQLSASFVAEDNPWLRVLLVAGVGGNGTAWFDGVQLTEHQTSADTNLLQNGSFENGITGWQQFVTPPSVSVTVLEDAAGAKDGDRYTKIEFTNLATACELIQEVADLTTISGVQAGQTLKFTAWYKSSFATNDGSVSLHKVYGTSEGAFDDVDRTYSASISGNKSEWTQIEYTFQHDGGSAKPLLRVIFAADDTALGSAGTIWLDNMSLEAIETPNASQYWALY